MLLTKRIRICLILITLSFGTALHSKAQAQSVSAADSLAIAPVSLGEKAGPTSTADDVCEQRLLKAMATLEKAERALNSALTEIDARKALEGLYKEWIAVKDMIIAEQNKLITLLQKEKKGNSIKDRLMTVLKIAEKVALIAAGILIGGR